MDTTRSAAEIAALIRETTTETFVRRYTAKEAKSLAVELATALAAERDRADRAEARTLSLSREQVHRAVIAAGFNISARLSDGDVTSLWGALNEEATA